MPRFSCLLWWCWLLLGGVMLPAQAMSAQAAHGAPVSMAAPSPVPAYAPWQALADPLFVHQNAPGAGGGSAVAQDAEGFIWVATQSGLVRWDGYRFRSYVADLDKPGSLPDSFVTALYTDERGRVWVGTNAGGLALYDPVTDGFVPRSGQGLGRGQPSINALAGDGQGGVWIASAAGLSHLAAGDAGAVPLALDAQSAPGLPGGGVQTVLQDRSGALWVGTDQGLVRREAGGQRLAPVALALPPGTRAVITRLFEDSAGQIWIGTRANGVFVMAAGAPQAPQARAVQESDPQDPLATDRVMAITEAGPGEIWLGTDGAGIVIVDAASGRTRRLRSQPGQASSLRDNTVLALMRDRSGIVWVLSNSALSRHDPQQRAVLSLFGGSSQAHHISGADVAYVLALPEGRIWLAMGNTGIDILDPWRGRVQRLVPGPQGLPKARVLAMVAGPGGQVALATLQGLFLADASGQRIRRVPVPRRDPMALTWALLWDADTLWLGGDDGLWALDMADPERPRLRHQLSAERLGDARVVSLMRGHGRELWVGTQRGLLRVDVDSGAAEQLPVDTADPVRLPAGFVSSMLIDARGRLWFSSFGNGVLLLQGQDVDGRLRFRRLGLREGLPHLGVNKLLEDAHGDIWASTDDGLAVIDANSFAVHALQRPQGAGILAYWTNSGAVTASGELLFGGQGGLSVVRPDQLRSWGYRPPVVVTEARIGTQPVTLGRFAAGQAQRDAQASPQPLELPADVRSLWVEFSALDFSAPELNRYAHKLEGFDEDWIPTEATRRLASYTNLPPGDYVLRLRGSNRDGVWSEPPLALPIHVRAAWYQSRWFHALGAALALSLVAALVQGRTLYLRRRQRELKSLVAARTAELEQRSEELRESQRQLEKIAYADPLTGLPNRRLFSDDLRHQVAQARRGGPPFALLLIDLDGFKMINDTRGHDAGDALLVASAQRLTLAVREADRVARMGGDEFAVLLSQAQLPAAVDVICRRIVLALAAPVAFAGEHLNVTTSIGVALCPAQGEDPDRLYKAADLALYAAKRGGRNTWRWYSGAMAADSPVI